MGSHRVRYSGVVAALICCAAVILSPWGPGAPYIAEAGVGDLVADMPTPLDHLSTNAHFERGLAAGGGYLWLVADDFSGGIKLYQLSPTDGSVEKSWNLNLDDAAVVTDLVYVDGVLFLATNEGWVHVLDAETMEALYFFQVDGYIKGIAWDGLSLWANIYNGTSHVLARINNLDGTILEDFEVYSQEINTNPMGMGGGDGYVAVLVRDGAASSFVRMRLFDSIMGQCLANYLALDHFQGTSVTFDADYVLWTMSPWTNRIYRVAWASASLDNDDDGVGDIFDDDCGDSCVNGIDTEN